MLGVEVATNSFVKSVQSQTVFHKAHTISLETKSAKRRRFYFFKNDRGKQLRLKHHINDLFSTTPNNWCTYCGNGTKKPYVFTKNICQLFSLQCVFLYSKTSWPCRILLALMEFAKCSRRTNSCSSPTNEMILFWWRQWTLQSWFSPHFFSHEKNRYFGCR